MMRLIAAALLLLMLSLHAEELFVLTASSKIYRFPIDDGTNQLPNLVPITGLQPSESILGIDFRPATGQLFGVGSTSRLYVIDTVTGAATAPGANPFNTLLNGVRFGVDFNPIVDRLRVVSDAGQSLRVVPDSGALQNSDPTLAYAALDPAFGIAPHVVSVAYANNLGIATSTTLYAIDSTQDTLVTIGSVNGTVNPNFSQVFTVGKLGIDVSDLVGFDISGQTGRAYLLNTSALNETTLYAVNLATGKATLAGPLTLNGETIIDLTVAPAPTPFDMVVLRNNGQISRIDTRLPALTTPPIGVTGLQNGETIREIDYRPATGELTGLGNTGRVYTINPFTGVATQLFTDPVNPLPAFDMGIGLDFNPTVDALRIVTQAGGNARFLNSGLYTVDLNLAYATGDMNFGTTPAVAAVAYSNNVANAAATTIFYIDQALGILATSANPNGGELTTIGSLNLPTPLGATVGFDIAPSGTAFLTVNNTLYTIDLATGGTTMIASIGGGAVRGIAAVVQAAVPTLQLSSSDFPAVEGNPLRVVLQRVGSVKGTVSVDFTTQDGTATAPLNYTSVSGTLTLLDGQTSLEVDIPTTNDKVLSLSKSATITFSNPIGATLGTPSTATLTIFDLNDTDGDGFPNDVETTFNSDPNSAASTPFGTLPAGTAQALTVSKATVKLNFAKPVGSDSVSFSGTIPNTAVIPAAKTTVEVGSVLGKAGVVQVFTLDAKGKSTPKGLTIGAQKNGVSKVSFSVSKGTFAASLVAAGLTNINATKAPLTLNFNLYFNNIVYAASVNMLYTGKQGKSGSATKAK